MKGFEDHFRILVETSDGHELTFDGTKWPSLAKARANIDLESVRCEEPLAIKLTFYSVTYKEVAAERYIEGGRVCLAP